MLCAALPSAYAQFPKEPTGVTVLESRFGEGVKISYKEVRISHVLSPDMLMAQL